MTCSTGKVFFKTQKLADKRARVISNSYDKNDPKRVVMRSYRCEECGKYHLTSVTIVKKQKQLERFIQSETSYWEEKFNV